MHPQGGVLENIEGPWLPEKGSLTPRPLAAGSLKSRQLTDQHLLICPCLYPGAVIGLIVHFFVCVLKAGLLSAPWSLSSFQLSVLIL